VLGCGLQFAPRCFRFCDGRHMDDRRIPGAQGKARAKASENRNYHWQSQLSRHLAPPKRGARPATAAFYFFCRQTNWCSLPSAGDQMSLVSEQRAADQRDNFTLVQLCQSAVRIGAQSDSLATASQAGYRCFASIAEFRRYVQTEVLVEAAA
jgi:hypothetical protein